MYAYVVLYVCIHPSIEMKPGVMLSSARLLQFLAVVIFLPPMARSFSSEDYEEEEKEREKTPPPKMDLCDYDRCRHLQVPCKELQRLNGSACLCPATSSPSEPPDPPRLGDVHIWADQGRAEVYWCAPSSPVNEYWLLLWEGGDLVKRGLPLNTTIRRAEMEGLKPGGAYILCVVASNDAGESPLPEGSWADTDAAGTPVFGPCRHLSIPPTSHDLIHISVGIGVTLIFISSAALVWHFCLRERWGCPHRPRGRAASKAGEDL